MFREFLLQNWSLLLVLIAFTIALRISVFLDKKVVRRIYILIAGVFLLSVAVFLEFNYAMTPERKTLRLILMAVRYSATPFIIAQIIYSLIRKLRWFIFIPAIVLAVVDVVSIFTGIIFRIEEDNSLTRGVLGYFPYIIVGLYVIALVALLIIQSNKTYMEIIPVLFLSFALITQLFFPFVLGKEYSKVFCTNIGIALFIYYVFVILQQTKKDSLTGLLNRHAFQADVLVNPDEITGLVSMDMNGLKATNDNLGHAAGDKALVELAFCFHRALRVRQTGYRIGGDEFVILCRKTSEEELKKLIGRIEEYVSEIEFNCAIGYSYSADGKKPIAEMLKEADAGMYAAKKRYYEETGIERRQE